MAGLRVVGMNNQYCFRRQPVLRASTAALAILLFAPTASVQAQAAIGLSSVRAQGFQNEDLLFYAPADGDRFGWSLASGDFNGDGKLDIATAGSDLSVLPGDGAGRFGTAVRIDNVGVSPTAPSSSPRETRSPSSTSSAASRPYRE